MSFKTSWYPPYQFNTKVFSNYLQPEKQNIEESEVKSLSDKFTRPLEKDEHERFNTILDKPVTLTPNNGSFPITFTPRQLMDFLNVALFEKQLISYPRCEIGGGATRNVLDPSWEYSDVDVSYHLCYPDNDILVKTVAEFVIWQLKENHAPIDFTSPNLISWVIEHYLHNREKIVNPNGALIQQFIGLGDRGVDLKFIADETHRWNVASYDSMYISYPENHVYSIDAGIHADHKKFTQNLSHLKDRILVGQNLQAVSGLIFCVNNAQSHGVKISQNDQSLALQQFSQAYPQWNAGTEDRLKRKFKRHLKKHQGQDLRQLFNLLNFLSLIQCIEKKQAQSFYRDAIHKSLVERSIHEEALTLPNVAALIPKDSQKLEDLLILVRGIILYEFVRKKSEDASVRIDIQNISIDQNICWQLSLNHNGTKNHLSITDQSPTELIRSFIRSWTSFENLRKPELMSAIFNDLNLTHLQFNEENKYKIVRVLLDAFDQPALSSFLSEHFPKSNLVALYACVKHSMPWLLEESQWNRKFLLGNLWYSLQESRASNDAEAEKLIASLRRNLLRQNDSLPTIESIKSISQFLITRSPVILETYKKGLALSILNFMQQLETSQNVALINEAFKLIELAHNKQIIPLASLERIHSALLNACQKINGVRDPIELINLQLQIAQLHDVAEKEKTASMCNISRLLLTVGQNPGTYVSESRFKELTEVCSNSILASQQEMLWRKASLALFDSLLKYALEIDQMQVLNIIGDAISKLPNEILINRREEELQNPFSKQLLKGMSRSFLQKTTAQLTKHYSFFLKLFEATQKVSVEPFVKIHHSIKNSNETANPKIIKLFIQEVFKLDQSLANEILSKFKGRIISEPDEQEILSAMAAMKVFEALRSLSKANIGNVYNESAVNEVIDLIKSVGSSIKPEHIHKISPMLLENIYKLLPNGFLLVEKLLIISQVFHLLSADQNNEIAFKLLQIYAIKDVVSSEQIQQGLNGFFLHLNANKDQMNVALQIVATLIERLSKSDPQLAIKIATCSLQHHLRNEFLEEQCLHFIKYEENHSNLIELVREIIKETTLGHVFAQGRAVSFLMLLLQIKQWDLFIEAWKAYPYISILSSEETELLCKAMCDSENIEVLDLVYKVYETKEKNYPSLFRHLLQGYFKIGDHTLFSRIRHIFENEMKLESVRPQDIQDVFKFVFDLIQNTSKYSSIKTSKSKKDKPLTLYEVKQKYCEYLLDLWKKSQNILSDPSAKEFRANTCTILIQTFLRSSNPEWIVNSCELYMREDGGLNGDVALEIFEGLLNLPEGHVTEERFEKVRQILQFSFQKRLLAISEIQNGAQFIKFTQILKSWYEKSQNSELLIQYTFNLFVSLLSSRIQYDLNQTSLSSALPLLIEISKSLINMSKFMNLFIINTLIQMGLSEGDLKSFTEELDIKVNKPIKNSLMLQYRSVLNIIKKKTTDDATIQKGYDETMESLEKIYYFFPEPAREIVSKLIRYSLKVSPKWTEKAHRLFTHAIDLKVYSLHASEEEEDEKLNTEFLDYRKTIEVAITSAACESKATSKIALIHIPSIVSMTDFNILEEVLHLQLLVLKVHEILLADILSSTQVGPINCERYISFTKLLGEVLRQPGNISFQIIRIDFISEILRRTIYYPTIFSSVFKDLDIMQSKKKKISYRDRDKPLSILVTPQLLDHILSTSELATDPRYPCATAINLIKRLGHLSLESAFNNDISLFFDRATRAVLEEWIKSSDFLDNLNETIMRDQLLIRMQTMIDFHIMLIITELNAKPYTDFLKISLYELLSKEMPTNHVERFLIPLIKMTLKTLFMHPALFNTMFLLAKDENRNLQEFIKDAREEKKYSDKDKLMESVLNRGYLKCFLNDETKLSSHFPIILSEATKMADERSLNPIHHLIAPIVIEILSNITKKSFFFDSQSSLFAEELEEFFELSNIYITKIMPKDINSDYFDQWESLHQGWKKEVGSQKTEDRSKKTEVMEEGSQNPAVLFVSGL